MNNSGKIFEELLVLNAQSGDVKAFTLLVKRWNQKLRNQINWVVHDRELANDLAQESWIVINKNLNKLSDPKKFGPWALRIANNKSIDWIRKNKTYLHDREQRIADDIEIEEVQGDSTEELMTRLQKGLTQLKSSHLLILKMHYLQELKVDQISAVLGVPTGTVKSRLFKARETLKKIVQL